MKTASWFTYSGPGRIGVSRAVPHHMARGFRVYRALAPTREMLRLDHDRYRDVFFREILGSLDPQEQWDRLLALVAPHEPVLLCWERPPFTATNWCHRRMVAEWFKDRLGVNVPEIIFLKGSRSD